MSFSINTNITSLQAQGYLQKSSQFQDSTIQKVTSGLRIVSSGDDAAGLAIANSLRSDQAVLNQGVRNANDGLSTLQTIDGGVNNISQLLDRARTLATQSASGTFSGDRTVLNSEFQSVMQEIDRQAQSIGLNQNGQFAQSLSVFIGGGKGASTAEVSSNGSIGIDLSKSTVDTQSLGLTSFSALNAAAYNLGTGTTSVANIVSDATNQASNAVAGYTSFTFSGVGFGDTKATGALNQNTVSISVNTLGVTDGASLASAINAAIAGAGNAGSANATAFKNAGVSASIVTDASGNQKLSFSSADSTFEVQAGDLTANALLGNFVGATAVGAATTTAGSSLIAGGTQQLLNGANPQTFTYAALTTGTQALTFATTDANGAIHKAAVNLTAANGADVDTTIETINNVLQTQNDSVVGNIVAFKDATGNIQFASGGKQFTVTVGDSTEATKGLNGAGAQYSSSVNGAGSTADISTADGAKNAVSALSDAVQKLGVAQAAVGKGQNTLNYAISLAQSQVMNEAAAESRIRDADLASEAANLSKAQILVQAGTAALAQANSAPQAILSLLKD